MQAVIFLTLFSLMLALNRYLFKVVSHPSVIFSGIWLVIIILQYCCTYFKWLDLIPLSTDATLVFLLGTFFFTLGSLFMLFHKKEGQFIAFYPSVKINKYIDLFFLLIPIIGLPFFFQKLIEIAGSTSNFGLFLAKLRWELSFNKGFSQLGILNYLVPLSIFNFSIRLNSTNRLFKIVSTLTAIIYALLMTGRTYFLLMIIIYIGNLFLNKKMNSPKILVYIVVFLTLFTSLSYLQGKSTIDKEGDTNSLVKSSYTELLIYLTPSLNAYDFMINNMEDYTSVDQSLNTFRFFYLLSNKLGITDYVTTELVQPFVEVKAQTNVYTLYQPITLDFGIWATMPFVLFIGLFHAYIFQQAIKKRLWAYHAYQYSLYPLVMSFFQEQYFNLLSTWLQFTLLHFLYYLFIKKINWTALK